MRNVMVSSWWIKFSLWMGLLVQTQELAPQYDPGFVYSDRATHLVEHVSQIVFRVHPRGHCVTEEDEVLNKTQRKR